MSDARYKEKECPQCHKLFRSKGERCSRECYNIARLKPRIEGDCEKCGKHFITTYTTTNWIYKNKLTRRFCSIECRNAGKRTIEKVCIHCGTTFFVRPSDEKYHPCKFCSKKCQFEHMSGEQSPHYNKDVRIALTCKVCKQPFTRERWRLNQEGHKGDFCSQRCHYKFIENPLAPLPPRQEKKYVRLRAIYLKEHSACEKCGSTVKLELDHIQPIALFPELFDDPKNFQTLCKECHKVKTKEDIRRVLAARELV